jgi:hypothetical protein
VPCSAEPVQTSAEAMSTSAVPFHILAVTMRASVVPFHIHPPIAIRSDAIPERAIVVVCEQSGYWRVRRSHWYCSARALALRRSRTRFLRLARQFRPRRQPQLLQRPRRRRGRAPQMELGSTDTLDISNHSRARTATGKCEYKACLSSGPCKEARSL